MYQQVRVINRSLRGGKWSQIRSIAQVDVKNVDENQGVTPSQEWVNAKPVSAIPGPTPFGLVRGFLPGGVFYNKTLTEFTMLARDLYGPLVMVPGVFGNPSLLLSYNVNDFPAALRSEGIWPRRRGLETMTYHRTVKSPETFGDVVGLLSSNDEKWGNLRSAVNPILMQPRNVRLYLNNMLEVNNEFLQIIRETRDPKTLEMPDNFDEDINRLTFESVAVVALNQQIGLLRKDRDNEEAKELFKCLRRFFNLVFDLEVTPSIWKIIRTPKFHEIMRCYDTMNRIIISYINKAVERIESNTSTRSADEEASVVEKLLKIDKKVAVVMALDMLMAGVDTTSSTLVGILLCIAKNPEKQEKLRQEIRQILPQKDSKLTVDGLKNVPYLRACIKEGIRLYPIGIGSIRSAGEDIVMSGYQVPKKQNILIVSNPLLLEEAHVAKAKEYIPERWLRDEKGDQQIVNPFLYIPFGFGPRSCVGKRIVDLELEITVARLVRNFNIEFNYPVENAFKSVMINVPAIPLKFKFSELEN